MDTVTRAMTERTLGYGLSRDEVNRNLLGVRIQIPALLNKGMNLCWDRHLTKLEVVQ